MALCADEMRKAGETLRRDRASDGRSLDVEPSYSRRDHAAWTSLTEMSASVGPFLNT